MTNLVIRTVIKHQKGAIATATDIVYQLREVDDSGACCGENRYETNLVIDDLSREAAMKLIESGAANFEHGEHKCPICRSDLK